MTKITLRKTVPVKFGRTLWAGHPYEAMKRGGMWLVRVNKNLWQMVDDRNVLHVLDNV